MVTTSRHTLAATVAAFALFAIPFAHASGNSSKGIDYADFCVQSADMPKPVGEWDLKGNPKLAAYCKCFSVPFTARAAKAAQEMSANPDKFMKKMSDKSVTDKVAAEELGFRNTCRKQLGLPLATDPNAADAANASQSVPASTKRK